MRKVYIHCLTWETKVIVTEHDQPVEYMIERATKRNMVGNIYKGKVANVLPGMEAAFVDIGLDRNAYLYIDDVLAARGINKDEQSASPRIQDLLSVGDELMVQMIKESIGSKGPKITTNMTLPGRYLVYLPYGKHVGISRKISEDNERERLKEMGMKMVQDQEGLIIRTVCQGLSEEELYQDLHALREKWDMIKQMNENTPATHLVYQETDIISQIIRDLMNAELEACIVDDKQVYERLNKANPQLAEFKGNIELYQSAQNIFDYYNLTPTIEKAFRRKVWLKSGGYIIIDQTEALTAIDVNTGKYVGKQSLEDTLVKTNIEAAKEIAKQLRLRDIGGMIIIDFIDMTESDNRQAVLLALEEALSKDRTKTHIVGQTSLGLIELTRKKMRESLLETVSCACPTCEGKGYILSRDTIVAKLDHVLSQYAQQPVEAILLQAHPSVVQLLLEQNKEKLRQLEKRYNLRVFAYANPELHHESYEILFTGELVKVKDRFEMMLEGEH